MPRHRLSPLLDPESVAVVGASSREGALGRLILQGLRDAGFGGPVGVVSRRHRQVLGEPAVTRLSDLSFVPDVALVATPASALPQVLDDCAARGTRFMVVYGPGFERGTAHGRAQEAALLVRARQLGIRLIGPNCTELMRPARGLQAGFAPARIQPGPVAMLSQSGAVLTGLVDWAVSAGLGCSSVLSLGSSLDLDFSELLDWMLYDPLTESVLLVLEDIPQARPFLSSVRALARAKPVIIMKTGRGALAARRADAQPEAAPWPRDRVVDAAIARAGAVRADSTLALTSAVRLLATQRRPRGPRLAIVANGNGPGLIAADELAATPLELARLSIPTRRLLDRLVPGRGWPGNPVNLHTDASADRLEAALEAVLEDEGVDAALVVFMPQAVTPSLEAAQRLVNVSARHQEKPIAAVIAGGVSASQGKQMLEQAGIPQFLVSEHAINGLAMLERFTRNQRLLRQVPQATEIRQAPLGPSPVETSGTRVAGWLTPEAVATRLATFGIRAMSSGADGAIQSFVVGVRRDPVFGAVIGIGLGGPMWREVDDLAFELAPLDTVLAEALIGRSRAGHALHARGGLCELLVRLSALVCACPEIDQFTLNPVQVDAQGRILDLGRVQMHAEALTDRASETARYPHLAIHPYPQALEETLQLRSGESVLLRPIRPEDADLERAFIAHLSPETLYRRFMVPVRQLSDAMVERFTQIDYDRELALVVIQTGPQFAAVARILPTWEEGVAEFAIVVGDWVQGSGLGRTLMLRLIAAARARGYRALEGTVLAENMRMLRFCASLGFRIRAHPEDATERLVRLSL
jgi:acetyltransferase